MDGLKLAFQVVFPMLVLMGVGFIVKRWLKLSEESLKQMNKLVFNLFLPAVVFKNMYQSDFSTDFNGKLLFYGAITVLSIFVVLYIIVPRFVKEKRDASVLIQAMFRSNNVLFGITIIYAVFGQAAMGITSLMAGMSVFIYSVLAVFLFESMRGQKLKPAVVAKGIVKNPLIIASVSGTLLMLTPIRLPDMALGILDDVGQMATPLALLVLGATFQLNGFVRYKSKVIVAAMTKLVIIPGIFITAAILLGFRDTALLTIMTLFGAPTAVSSYPTAEALGGNGELAGLMVVFTSICSMVSIFLWILMFESFGFI